MIFHFCLATAAGNASPHPRRFLQNLQKISKDALLAKTIRCNLNSVSRKGRCGVSKRGCPKTTFQEIYKSVLKDYPDVLTVEEISKALGVSSKTGYQLVRNNKVRHLKMGRTYRIPKVQLLSYMCQDLCPEDSDSISK